MKDTHPYMVPITSGSVFVDAETVDYGWYKMMAVYATRELAGEDAIEYPIVIGWLPGCLSQRGKNGKTSTCKNPTGARCTKPAGHASAHWGSGLTWT